jgi:hypothetical protein
MLGEYCHVYIKNMEHPVNINIDGYYGLLISALNKFLVERHDKLSIGTELQH